MSKMKPAPLELEIYIDGASKGNPGPAGVGVIICKDGGVLKNISGYIGETTNNFAEYTALLYALREALIMKADKVRVNTDSELLHRQIRREYKVKNATLFELYSQACELMSAFHGVTINHIPREQNTGADKLATLAIRNHFKKGR